MISYFYIKQTLLIIMYNNNSTKDMSLGQQSQIIDLVITIFQNVGIKRFIDKIQTLKNYQIYFQICKVIFPQTMIQLLRFSEGPTSNSDKIQGVISIVGKILQNDLYHISGISISQGKLSHIRNFLHILELLSQNVHQGNRNQEEVQSAPENSRSFQDYQREGHYTVIGIDKEFQREFQDDQEFRNHQEQETKRQYRSYKDHPNQYTLSENQSSQTERPMIPVLDNNVSQKKNRKKKFARATKPIQEPKLQQVKVVNPIYTFAARKAIPIVPLQDVLKKAQPRQYVRKKLKSQFIKKTNQIIQDIQLRNLQYQKQQHNQWVLKNERKQILKQNKIKKQSQQRIEFTNQLLKQKAKKINALKDVKWVVNVVGNLFKQQQNVLKSMKIAKQHDQILKINNLIQNDFEDQRLLRQVLLIGKPLTHNHKKK